MLLEIKNLSVNVATPLGDKSLVENINLAVAEQRIVGLVGGSGSGKTTTGLAVLRLLSPPVTITQGEIIFMGKDLLTFSGEQMRRIRGRELAMVFQEPLTAMNPVFTVSHQITEVLAMHTGLNSRQRQDRVQELLASVGIPEPARVSRSYPHQLSGGLRQRAMIAQAIALNPRLIIADEPTSNLDVTVQARIIELFEKLKADMKISILLITHDLGMIRHVADEVAVMQEGKIVEAGTMSAVLNSPKCEYTRRLLKAAG